MKKIYRLTKQATGLDLNDENAAQIINVILAVLLVVTLLLLLFTLGQI